MADAHKDHWKAFTEEIEIAGSQLVEKVTELIRAGNVRRLRVKARDGRVLFELPLTLGAGAGGVLALAAPWLAVLAALAGVFARVKLEIVRKTPDESSRTDRPGSNRPTPEDIDL